MAQCALFINSGASFSPCRKYRYALWRAWDYDLPSIVFIGLNPSTANESLDDPTIRRVMRFAKSWGYGSVTMLNLFGIISPDPTVLDTCADPVGDNDKYLRFFGRRKMKIVFAWGNFTQARTRSEAIKEWFPDPYCLGKNANGTPKHPLYLKRDTTLTPFN